MSRRTAPLAVAATIAAAALTLSSPATAVGLRLPGAQAGAAGTWRFLRGGFNGAAVPAGGSLLPAGGADGHGSQWMVYQPAYLQCQSNMPVYNQTANLQVNGQQPSQTGNNTGHIDDKTGELVMDDMQAGTLTVSRRVLLDTDVGGVRVTDVIRNPTAADQPATVVISSTLNYGPQQPSVVADPKHPGHVLAWVAPVPAGPGRTVADVYAGPAAKVSPTIDNQAGNNVATANLTVPVPAHSQVAIVHYHLVFNSADAATQWVTHMRPGKLLADLPKDVRRSVVNFGGGGGGELMGDQDVLRGDLLDVVELRNGDKLNGTLAAADGYALDTFYGTVDLPADRVVGLVNTGGAYRPRQLLVTTDGQIFGGHLRQPTVALQLTTGQTVKVPLAQIARVGYHRRATEADADATNGTDPVNTLRPPYVLLTTGDRVGVRMAAGPVPFMTRYGPLSLPAAVVSAVALTSDDPAVAGVHTVTLVDGSHFTGLVTLPSLDVTLNPAGNPATTGPATTAPATAPTTRPAELAVRFPIGSISRIVFAGDDPADAAPTATATTGGDGPPQVTLRRDDLLVGTLSGPLKIDTAFDTLTVDAAELRSLARPKDGGPADLAVTTWDGTTFNGQVEDPTVACHLSCGVDLRVPIDQIDGYANPTPAVPAMLRDQIAALVKQLDADDWQQRDAAERQLVKLGPGVAGPLRAVRDKQSPEAQQRIDAVLRQTAHKP